MIADLKKSRSGSSNSSVRRSIQLLMDFSAAQLGQVSNLAVQITAQFIARSLRTRLALVAVS